MPIPVVCGCTAKLKVADGLLGQQVKCPKCSKVLPVAEPKSGSPYYQLWKSSRPSVPSAPARPTLTKEQVLEQSPLSEAEREKVEEVLESGEQLLWAGKPDAEMAFASGWFNSIIFFSIAVTALIALIVVTVASIASTLVITGLILATIVLAALGFATPFHNRWRMGKWFYALTDRRTTVWGCDKFGKISMRHYEPAELHGFYFKPSPRHGDTAGDLIFGSRTETTRTGGDTTTTSYVWGFLKLREAKTVEKLLRETLVDPLLDKIYE